MATIFTVFPPERRGMAMGVFGLGVVFAPAIGPTLGGMMIEYFSWRYVFFISLPFCLIAAVMGLMFMPTRPIPSRIPPFDWLGFALLCTGLFGLMTGIADGQREGWNSDTIVLRLLIGAVAGIAFVLWELHTPRALLDVRIFANIEFSAAALIAFIFGAGMMGSTYIMPVFVQTIIGFTPLLAGLMMMPAGIMLAFIFPLAGRLADAMPASTMIIGGLLLFSAGFALMAVADIDTTFWTLVGMVMVSRLGLGFINPSLNASSLKALPADKVRQGAGVANFMRQLGGAFGINLMVAFFEVRTRFHADALTATQHWGNRTTDRLLQLVEQLMQRSGLPLPAAEGRRLRISERHAARRGPIDGLLRHLHRGRRGGAAGADPGRHAVAVATPHAAARLQLTRSKRTVAMAAKDRNVVGVWRLVSTRATDPEGRQVGVPFGPRGMGLVTLTVRRPHDVGAGRRAGEPAGRHTAAVLVLLRQLHVRRQHPHHHRRRQLRSRAFHRAAGPQGPLRRRAHDPDAATLRCERREGDARTDVGTHQRGVALGSLPGAPLWRSWSSGPRASGSLMIMSESRGEGSNSQGGSV